MSYWDKHGKDQAAKRAKLLDKNSTGRQVQSDNEERDASLNQVAPGHTDRALRVFKHLEGIDPDKD